MQKKAKVTQVSRNPKGDYTNKQGKQMFCWNIVFDNQDAGETHSTSADKCRFIEGQEHQYDIHVKMDEIAVKVLLENLLVVLLAVGQY